MSRNALIVGINRYQYLPDLKAPALDAEAIAQRLQEDGEFRTQRLPEKIEGINEKKPIVSKEHTVSAAQFKKALTTLFLPDSKQLPETALFYFSGHGLPDQDPVGADKGFLAASDTDPKNPSSGISLNWLQLLLSKSPIQRQIIWLDCCHSGSILVNVGAANPGHGESKDRCFIASSRDFEDSYEDLNSSHSVLARALLDGLDPKRLPRRWIDTFSLVDFINQALKGELQTPVCTNFGEAINLTFRWQAPEASSPENQVDSNIYPYSPNLDEAFNLTQNWQVLEETTTRDNQVDSGFCPYKGLEFFDCNNEDPKYFFGREQLVGQLLDQVRTSNFLALVGASGNGKSSVLRAGLLHQLKLGLRISGSDQWRIRITRPDRKPMQNLAQAFIEDGLSDLDRAEGLSKASELLKDGALGLQRLVQASSSPRTVLVIDQFEEVFTRCENLEEREHFFACLMGALSDTDDKLCLIIAMRSDFIVKCHEQEYSGLARLIDQQMVSVLPMKADELKAAICRPAEQVNLQVEPELVTEILNDIGGAPGSLPLLQYTLKELWNQRQDNQLTLASYQKLGGIQGTLDQRATAIYNSFDEAEQQTVQHIFQQLTQLGEGTEDTRRRVFQADFVAEPKHPAQRVQQVIGRLSSPENRLIVTSEAVSKYDQSTRRSIVDVAHEALIRHWKLLRHWIEQNRDLLRKQQRIEADALTWRNQDQNPGYLLQGLPLIDAVQFQKAQAETFPLSDNSKAFIQNSMRQRRINRLKTGAWLIIPAVFLIIVIELNVREYIVREDYARLDFVGTFEEKRAVEDLVEGCRARQKREWLPKYVTNRLFGNCRSLEGVPLAKAQLSGANLHSAYLHSAELGEAYLHSAVLNEVNLSEADLKSADLSGANLLGAYLESADLSGAILLEVNLRKSNLFKANLREAKILNANLDLAYLESANFDSTDLRSSTFKSANISSSTLIGANLIGANLNNTNLIGANLIGANLIGANLKNANLSNAIFLKTDLRKIEKLTSSQLEGKEPPLICNSPLPQNIKIDINRDCNKVAAALHERYPMEFSSLNEAENYVQEQRLKQWD